MVLERTGNIFVCSVRANRRRVFALALLGYCLLVAPVLAQQQDQDPEVEKQTGLWLDQGISADLTRNRSVELEFHQRFDEGASNLFEYFGQGGIAFRLRPWVMVLPSYRYQRYPGDSSTSYENRLILNFTFAKTQGQWRPNLRVLTEGRFPENRVASGRFRFRPGIDYVLPLRVKRAPVLVTTNEFFLVPGTNSFSSGGSFTQNRFQVGIRVPITNFFAVRPYYMLQSANRTTGWETTQVLGFSLTLKAVDKSKSKK
jgi:hypothetical protein